MRVQKLRCPLRCPLEKLQTFIKQDAAPVWLATDRLWSFPYLVQFGQHMDAD